MKLSGLYIAVFVCFISTPFAFSQKQSIWDIDQELYDLYEELSNHTMTIYNLSDEEDAYSKYEERFEDLRISFYTALEKACKMDSYMDYDFPILQKHEPSFEIIKSEDKCVRVFSWNTFQGGTMPDWDAYIQFRVTEKAYSTFLPYLPSFHSNQKYLQIYKVPHISYPCYILCGVSQLMSNYPFYVMRAVRFSNEEVLPANIFMKDIKPESYLSLSYRDYPNDLPKKFFPSYSDGFPAIGIDEKSFLSIYLPLTEWDDDINGERITGEVETFRLRKNIFVKEK